MHDSDNGASGRKPYSAPTMRKLEATDVIRKLLHELDGPLGDTPEARIEKAAALIRSVLDRLPLEERDEAVAKAVGASGRWVKCAAWSP